MRPLRLLGLIAGLALCHDGLTAGARAEGRPDPERVVERAAASIARLHQNASRALVNAAQDEAYAEYFHALAREDSHDHDHDHDHGPGEGAHHHETTTALKERIDRISLSVQERFAVEEMCLIDLDGREVSRIVGDEIAHDLATDEASASFFAPGFATPYRKVYVAPLYLSTDADKWVVAYVTPILVEGEARSILHYERGLSAYTAILDRVSAATGAKLLVVTASNHLVYDSRAPVFTGAIDDAVMLDDSFARLDAAAPDAVGWLAPFLGRPAGSVAAATRIVEDWMIVAWVPK